MKEEKSYNDFLRRRLSSESEHGLAFDENSRTRLEGNTQTSRKSTVQSADVGHRDVRAGRIVAGLLAALALIAAMLAAPVASPAQLAVGISVSFGPPALPYYVQPLCPGPGYIWTPGYWAWDPEFGYFWVPGTWVLAPFVGALWTPGYWDYDDGAYVWYAGYWGPAVGYYGGIDYGYGYTGDGYYGGHWNHGTFYYNRTVNNITNVNITNVYNEPVDEHFRDRHISYHGGPGGTTADPTPAQMAAARQRRSPAVSQQEHQLAMAKAYPDERAQVNHGRPRIAATQRPGDFDSHDAVPAKSAGGPYHAPPREAKPGGNTARHAHHGNDESIPDAAPNPQPARHAPERPEMREQAQPESNPPHEQPERRAPNHAQPPEARQPEPHARHATPPGHAHQAPAAKHTQNPPQEKHGDGHGHEG